MTMSRRTFFLLALIAGAAASRLLPHPPNVSPIASLALLGGATLPVFWSFAIPLSAMFLSDLVVGFDSIGVTVSVYGSFLLTVFVGRLLRQRTSPGSVLSASLGSSVLFYLVTNAAVWAFSDLYPQTADGLALSYFYALPFFRNTLFGDLAYSTALFGAFFVLPRLAPSLRQQRPLATVARYARSPFSSSPRPAHAGRPEPSSTGANKHSANRG
jgi:uncharacterized protein DUF6580